MQKLKKNLSFIKKNNLTTLPYKCISEIVSSMARC